MNSEINSTINVLPPFKKICMTIGELPASYLETMTYYEMLVWFTNYLQDTVIPTINNNASAVSELQNLYLELENYVNTYFDNLDVQEEINKKLDDMASDGSLTNLIKDYVTPFINAQNTEIAIIRNDVNRIDNKVDATVSGSPLSASSVSDMTDTTRIYVNTTDGYWYYYDGTQWTQGGIYQSTELADGSITRFNLNGELQGDIYNTLGTKNLYNSSTEGIGMTMGRDQSSANYGKFISSSSLKGFILPVIPSSTITITKIESTRFRIATSTDLPAVGVSYNEYFGRDSDDEITIELTANDNYIFVNYYSSSTDTLTETQIKDSIKVYYGTTWTNPKTQVNKLKEDLEDGGVSTNYLKDKSVTIKKTNFMKKYNEGTENLYNSDSAGILMHAVTDEQSSMYGKFQSGGSLKGFILPVTPSSTITISKITSQRFRVATSTDLPANGVAYNQYFGRDSQNKITVELNNDDNYIFVDYYSTSLDTLPEDDIKESIRVYYGTEWVDTNYKINELINNFNNLSPDILKLTGYRQLGSFDKGYLCLIADDGNMALSTNTFDILKEYEVPATFALMSNSAIMNEQTGDITGLKDMIDNYGCSVCQHGSTPFDEYTADDLINFLKSEQEFWESKDITVKGLCYPWHHNNPLIRSICGSMYDICCGGSGNSYITAQYQVNTERSNIFALSRTSVISYEHLNDAVDYAVANNKLMIIFWHDIAFLNDPNNQTTFENFLTYAKASGIEFITLDKIMNL